MYVMCVHVYVHALLMGVLRFNAQFVFVSYLTAVDQLLSFLLKCALFPLPVCLLYSLSFPL